MWDVYLGIKVRILDTAPVLLLDLPPPNFLLPLLMLLSGYYISSLNQYFDIFFSINFEINFDIDISIVIIFACD